MKRQDKVTLVDRITAEIAAMPNIFVAEYRGMTVEQITDLRTKVRKASGGVRVLKNTFLRRAVAGTGKESVAGLAKGPNAVILGRKDVVDLAKVLAAAAKESDKFQLKGGVVDGKAVTAAQIRQIAELPPRAVLLGRAVGSMASPLRGFVTVCQGNIRNLVYALDAVRRAKEQSAA
ncbi:MAG: 50S ribosomal protein L10 [Acidobacteria bacterium]|nr:50S ribosomal protein L10 [Acidobacteriota bacterium]